ncbi:MAG: MurT ligase domain-containing protein [Oscillospiraceae bacterium]|nr:MurT ligase domain-containing protein [Oscillospiraceae bacterium]
MKIKAILAILLCKALKLVSRILHRGGTAMPGRWALKICPELLGYLAKDVRSIAITGTNGKTSSARMMEEALRRDGRDCFANRSGANLLSGITTEFVANCTLTGRMKKHCAVIECDEAASGGVFRQLKPEVIIVTNVFRDQLDRYGEVTHTVENIRKGILGAPEAIVCLNADCSLTASLAEGIPNRVVWYGIEAGAVPEQESSVLSDAAFCIKCKTRYEYDYVTYGHLGGFRCPNCGYSRHEADYAVVSLIESDLLGSTAVLSGIDGTERRVRVNLPAVYNLYNAAGAYAACTEAGVHADAIVTALGTFKCGFGRYEHFELGKEGTTIMLVKNPAGCSRVLEFLEGTEGPFAIAVCLNDRDADGTDISWIWDADFERLENMRDRIVSAAVGGIRARDLAMRLKYAGADPEKTQVIQDYEKLTDWCAAQECPVYILPTYTAMLDLRHVIVKRCGGSEFWEG